MALAFAGEFVVKRSLEEVYDFITDPNRFAPVLPYFQGLTIADDRNFEVRVTVGISHIRGIAEVKLNLEEAERPRRLLYRGKGRLAGGSVDFNAGFDLETNAEGTRVRWKGEAQVFGVLTSVAGGLLRPLAQKNAQKAIDGLQAALGQAPVVSSPLPVASLPSLPAIAELSALGSDSGSPGSPTASSQPAVPESEAPLKAGHDT